MFETNVDTLYTWAGLSAVSVAVLGVIVGLPTTAPPDATGVAATIDEVATSPPGSVAHRQLDADELSVTDGQVALRNDGGSAHASVMVTPVPARTANLDAVLDGANPKTVYDSPESFREDAFSVQSGGDEWHPAPDRLTVRRVAWGGVDVTLVG